LVDFDLAPAVGDTLREELAGGEEGDPLTVVNIAGEHGAGRD
jgi:hypothetical protein